MSQEWIRHAFRHNRRGDNKLLLGVLLCLNIFVPVKTPLKPVYLSRDLKDEDTMTSSVSSHQLLIEEVDESGVERINIVSSTEDKNNPKGYDTYRYPR